MKEIENHTKVLLTQDEMPRKWYNVLPDLPRALDPPLDPKTREPVDPKMLMALFSKEVVMQEMSPQNYIDIPEEVAEAYLRLGRPTPLYRARRLEQYLKTPARIYFKREDLNPCGSHKPNTAIAQAYYAKKEGVEKLTTETGAGQWGTALSYACMTFGMDCTVFMVRVSYEQKPFRKTIMGMYGATVHPSPSTQTESGKAILKENPKHPGSLGVAISEAVESAVRGKNTKYSLGSVLNHVLMHQTVIGQEVMAQLNKIDETPDVMIGCIGGGSNFGGFTLPYVREKLKKKMDIDFIAVEPTAAPSVTEGKYEYDFGDTAELAPLVRMYTLGHKFIPSEIHAGGLRYHGMSPIVSLLAHEKVIRARAYEQKEVFDAAYVFAKTEGIVPAPETSHAIKATIDEALACKKTGEEKVIAFNFSGHGLLDLRGYQDYLEGKI
ncbi:MAG: TrpB-like pyridoxal phosphate-dependent enzyme [Candidatus Micrarchaeota archaeon]